MRINRFKLIQMGVNNKCNTFIRINYIISE